MLRYFSSLTSTLRNLPSFPTRRSSDLFFVIQAQRDLSAAQSVEVRALVDLVKAKVDFDRALGRTLEVNRISIAGAKQGTVPRDTLIPGTSVSGELVGPAQKF